MYRVNFHEVGLVPETGKIVVKDFECGGINADKFGNLFFVNKNSQNIQKISAYELRDNFSEG